MSHVWPAWILEQHKTPCTRPLLTPQHLCLNDALPYLACATPPCTAGCQLVAWEASHISWSLRKGKKGGTKWEICLWVVCRSHTGLTKIAVSSLVLSAAYMQVLCSLWCGGRACTRASCTWDWSKADLEREKLCLAACYDTTLFFFFLVAFFFKATLCKTGFTFSCSRRGLTCYMFQELLLLSTGGYD